LSEPVPEDFATVVAAVDAVSTQLGAAGSFTPTGPGRWIYDFEIAWDEPIQHVAFVLDVDGPLLAVYVVLRLPDPSRDASALALGVARANYGLLPGCFETDGETGETRYRSVLPLLSGDLDPQPVGQLFADALIMAQTYAPAFARIVASDADPVAAVDDLEAAL
jgi:hypothetical protein